MFAFWVHRWINLTSRVLRLCSAGIILRRSITYQVLGARLVDRGATVGLLLLGTMLSLLARLLDVQEQTLAVARFRKLVDYSFLSSLHRRLPLFLLFCTIEAHCIALLRVGYSCDGVRLFVGIHERNADCFGSKIRWIFQGRLRAGLFTEDCDDSGGEMAARRNPLRN